MQSTLGKRLRTLREDSRYTQEHLSNLLHIERQTYTNYENGYRTPPLDSLVKLADFFHVSLDQLVRGAHINPSHQSLSPHEHDLIYNYSRLRPAIQQEVQDFVRFKIYYAKTI